MEMSKLYAHADNLSRFGNSFSHRLLIFWSHFTQTVTKVNPMFGRGVPQSPPELAAQPMWECAPPSFFFLPPFLLQSVWTTPKQEVHFLFFLKKDLAASIFSAKLACATHYPDKRCSSTFFCPLSVNSNAITAV